MTYSLSLEPEDRIVTWEPKLIVSDVDGTFLDSRERVSPELREVVERAGAQGVFFALATGRPPRWIYHVLDQLSVRAICVCANGAVLYDSASDRVLRAHTLSPEVLRTVVSAVRENLDCGIAVERSGASAFDHPAELFAVTPGYVHAWESDEHGMETENELLSRPAMKLLLRNDALTANEMYALAAPAIPEELAHVTFSIDHGLLEVSAPGVNKAAGLQDLAELLGVDPADAVAFGDMPNDVEMLQWAGHGVAMGNAHEALKQVADEITTSNNDAGVARILQRWF